MNYFSQIKSTLEVCVKDLKSDDLRAQVSARYGQIGKMDQGGCCCSSTSSSCCGQENAVDQVSAVMGYSLEELSSVPKEANLGLGCGNPQAIASLKQGEYVLDLGSGGGFDAFLAAKQVGESGYVIGVDMTPEMVSRARLNAEKGNYSNVDFRLGEIENLPVGDSYVDVIISNCVINLSPDKQRVFDEAFRVLKIGGRLAVSDVIAIDDVPENLKNDIESYARCISGASSITDLKRMLLTAGFVEINIEIKKNSDEIVSGWAPDYPIARYIASAIIQAKKPSV